VGLYRAGSLGFPDRPDGGALVVETASLAQVGMLTTSLHFLPIADTQLTPGLYFGAVQGDDATGTSGRFQQPGQWSSNVGGQVIVGSYYDQGYGAFTDPCPVTVPNLNTRPWIVMRVKSIP